jgi:hypothetical protein
MNSIKALYIYSDICENQHVGDAFVQLLRAEAVDKEDTISIELKKNFNSTLEYFQSTVS